MDLQEPQTCCSEEVFGIDSQNWPIASYPSSKNTKDADTNKR